MKKFSRSMTMTLVSLFFLSACGAPASPASSGETATKPAPLAEVAVTETVATAAGVDECVVCHTDKQTLIETAKPEEIAESESKGVG